MVVAMLRTGMTRTGIGGFLAVALVVGLLGVGAPAATAATVTEFGIPTAGAQPIGIAAGPDGGLWFTENSANKIGRVTTAGTFTEFNGNKIGRITTAGTFTEFTIPTPSSAPLGIAAGPDGALWFTEAAADKVGRITTGGTITEFAVPTASSSPYGGSGADTLTDFQNGRETAGDRFSGGAGNDQIDDRDGNRDIIDCGAGRDSVLADTRDKIARNCERVQRKFRPPGVR